MTYPANGAEMMQLRCHGQRPAGMVCVGFGQTDYPPPCVMVQDSQIVTDLDYRFLHDLDVCLMARVGDDPERSIFAAELILRVKPRNLYMYVIDTDYWMTLVRDHKRVSWVWYGAEFLRYCGDDENHNRQH